MEITKTDSRRNIKHERSTSKEIESVIQNRPTKTQTSLVNSTKHLKFKH